MRIVVVGGGISGLAAAWAAARAAEHANQKIEVTVLEAAGTVGGKAITVNDGDWQYETGPIGFMDNEPALNELLDDVGLREKAIAASTAAEHRFLLRKNKLVEIRANPVSFAASGIIGPFGLLQMGLEPFLPKKTDNTDESVWEFAARRLGKQFADRLISPMTLGVFAGDARKLSLESAFPIMADLEREHGSIIRGALARKKRSGKKGVYTSFEGGLGTLTRHLVEKGGFDARCNETVLAVSRSDDGSWSVKTAGGSGQITADAVIVASEAWATADFIEQTSPAIAAELRKISFPPVTVVAAGYRGEDATRVPNGFGVLIPRPEGVRTLGVTWDSRMFPGRCEDGSVLVRAMMGGTFDSEISDLPNGDIEAVATSELAAIFGFTGPPDFIATKVWKRAIPQYEIGHRSLVASIENSLLELPGLHIAGNSLHGTAFGKSAATGVRTGRKAVSSLLQQ